MLRRHHQIAAGFALCLVGTGAAYLLLGDSGKSGGSAVSQAHAETVGQNPTKPNEPRKQTAKASTRRSPAQQTAALRDAAEKGDLAAVLQLTQAKVDVNAKDAKGRTPLMLAAANGHAEVARALIRAKANVNARSRNGETALMAASRSGDVVTVVMLLQNRGSTDAKNKKGETAYTLAKRKGHDVIADVIQENSARRVQRTKSVSDAQRLLVRLGYRPGPADGQMGPSTARAIRKFQKKQKLQTTGEVTPKLVAMMEVLVAQRLLSKLGYKPGPADGQMGGKTRKAVKRFQRDNRMRSDGEVTSKLVAALGRKASGSRKSRTRKSSSRTRVTTRTKPSKSERLHTRPASAPTNDDGQKDGGENAGWFGRTKSTVGGWFGSGSDGPKDGETESTGQKVRSFFRENASAHAKLVEKCDAGESWVQDANGNWVDCSAYQ